MALSYDLAPPESAICLDEYLEFVDRQIDLRDLDSICESRYMFKRLLSNKTFMTDRLNSELLDWTSFQSANRYSGPVMLFASNERYIVRANIWQKPRAYEDTRLSDDSVYSYLDVHDHNFTFMTGGYYGRGYETVIWEWDGLDKWPNPGDHVDIRFLEKTSLPEGKIMVYRGSRDIHRQEHARDFSISLNLLIKPPIGGNRQYRFDVDEGTVLSSTTAGVATRESLCDIARMVGDENTRDLLDHISTKHKDPTLRAAAIEALFVKGWVDEDELLRRAAGEKSPYIRSLVERESKRIARLA